MSNAAAAPTQAIIGLNVLEFFCGIGGMRLALEQAVAMLNEKFTNNDETNSNSNLLFKIESITAVDINVNAMQTYEHNFHSNNAPSASYSSKFIAKLIEQIKVSDLDGKANMWTMSPPCQPFCGMMFSKHKDMSDNRNKGWRHLMNMLQQMKQKPQYIVLENVKGLVGSPVLEDWKQVLVQCGYGYFKQFLLSPLQFGYPNSRTRYYMIAILTNDTNGEAKRTDEYNRVHYTIKSELFNNNNSSVVYLPDQVNEYEEYTLKNCSTTPSETQEPQQEQQEQQAANKLNDSAEDDDEEQQEDEETQAKQQNLTLQMLKNPNLKPISQFIQSTTQQDKTKLWLSDQVLLKPWFCTDCVHIVIPQELLTCCFTSSYMKVKHRSAGSFLLDDQSTNEDVVQQKVKLTKDNIDQYKGKIRLFSPKEISMMMGFPREFNFPSSLSARACYKLIGNSINVTVVSHVIAHVLEQSMLLLQNSGSPTFVTKEE